MHSIKELSGRYSKQFSTDYFNPSPNGLYEPMKHIMAIPGKRIRPLLLLLANDAFGGASDDAIHASHAMELFHNFTLVHDDIMDAAPLRRGVITVHEKYGTSAGILSGDALFSYAYKHLCEVPETKLGAILKVFNKTAIEIMEGQQMDIDFERRMDVTIDEYLTMIAYKTSVLLACSLQIGSIIGNASLADQRLMYEFGMNLGLSFQIKDDWLDTFGEGAKVGKQIGGDIIQNKKTYLLITLLNEVKGTDRDTLESLLKNIDSEKKIAGVKQLMNQYQVSEKTLSKAENLYQVARTSLANVSIDEAQKDNLYAMADMVNKREF